MEDNDDTINVVVRVRPIIHREHTTECKEYWKVEGNSIYLVNDGASTSHENCYIFDYIFDMDKKNADVYNTVKPIVQSAINGINGTVFAYGQTSSGKTHSIMGNQYEKGIIPLAIDDIFNIIQNDNKRKYLLRSSYIEIYNDKINDLLNKSQTDLKIREDISGALTISNCVEEITRSSDELMEVVNKGNKNRQIFSTAMNERSSRSHVIFKIVIESSPNNDVCGDEEIPVQVSQLYFVDLAGSERAAQTKATGARLKEGGHINKSLSILSRVIRQLGDNVSHINFRDSKLTRLLSNALGGNCKTLIIAAITPVSIDNTQSTLMFAQAAKKIKTKPRVNQVLTNEALIKQQKNKEKQLINQLQIERTKNITLQVSQSMKDQMIKDLEQQIKNIELSYVRTEPIRASTRRHTMGFERPSSAMYSKIPLLRISEEIKPSTSATPEPAPSKPPEETLDAITIPDEMDVSEVDSTGSTPKRVLRQRILDLNQSHTELKEFNKHEHDLNTMEELENLNRELETERAKRRETEQRVVGMMDLIDKLEIRNSEIEISMGSLISRCKIRENELLDVIAEKKLEVSQPMDVCAIDSHIEFPKNDFKMQCEDPKTNKEFQIREDKLCLEAKLSMAREQNKILLEENSEIKFRENLLKNKILGSSQNQNMSTDDLTKINKCDLRKSISDSTIFVNDEPIMVRSSSSPNINDHSVGLTNSSEEIFEDLRKGFSSLQSLLAANSSDVLPKSARVEINMDQDDYVKNLQLRNNDLEQQILTLQQQNEQLQNDHSAQLNIINEDHSAQVISYENTVKELTGYNKTLADEYNSQLTQANTQASIELNDGELKLANANITISQLQEQLRVVQEELSVNEKNKLTEMDKIQNNYSEQLTALQQDIMNKHQEENECTVEMEMIKQALTKYEKEVETLKLNISKQNEYSSERYRNYETVLNEMQRTMKNTVEEREREVKLDTEKKMNIIMELEANISSLQSDLEIKNNENSEVLLEVKRLQALLETNQSSLEAVNKNYEAMQLQLQQENKSLNTQIEATIKERGEAFQETRRMEELYETTMNNLAAASEYSKSIQHESNIEMNRLKLEIDQVIEERRLLVIELTAVRQQHEQIKAASDEQLQILKNTLDAKEEQIIELRTTLAEKDERLEKIKNDLIQDYKSKVDELEEDRKRQEAAMIMRDTQIRELTTSLKNASDQASMLKKKLSENDRNNEEMFNEGTSQIRQLQEELHKKQRELKKSEKLYDAMKVNHSAEVKSLEDKIKHHEERLNRENQGNDGAPIEPVIKREIEDNDRINIDESAMPNDMETETKPVRNGLCDCPTAIGRLEEKLNTVRNKLADAERVNDELEQNFRALNNSQTTELSNRNQEIATLTQQIVEFQQRLAQSKTELKDAKMEIEDLRERYQLQTSELKSQHQQKESELKLAENTKLIRNHMEQIEAYENKLRSVNSINDRLMLESTEQVKQLERQVQVLQEKIATAYKEHANQIDNVRAVHSEEMRVLMQANDQKDSLKINELKEAYEHTLQHQKHDIEVLQKKLQEQLANFEATQKVYSNSQEKLTNALNAAEEKHKNSLEQYEQLKISHENKIKQMNENHKNMIENIRKNDSLIKTYSKKNEELETEISNLNMQILTASKNSETMTESYLTNVTKINTCHREEIKSLKNLSTRKEEEFSKITEVLMKEKSETLKLKEELNKARSLITKLTNISEEHKKMEEENKCKIHILNTTITNIRAINEQHHKAIKELEKEVAAKGAEIKEMKKINDSLEEEIKKLQAEEKEESDTEAAVDLPEVAGKEKISAGALNAAIECASCKKTIEELKATLYKTTTHNSKLIDNCFRLKSKNQSLQCKINDLRRALEKTKSYMDNFKKILETEKGKTRKALEQLNASNSDLQIVKAKLEVEYVSVEKLNKRIQELQTAQKMYRTHLKEQTSETRFEEANTSKSFQEGVKERRQSMHDQRRNIDSCDKCQKRRTEIEEYQRSNKKLIEINQMLNEQHKILESKLRGEEDSDALELQAQFNCTEILLRNLNRFMTKGYDTCEYCTSLLNFINRKVLVLSKISENNSFWYIKTESDSQTIDEVLNVINRFRANLGDDLANESLIALESVKNKLDAAKNVLLNKRGYIESFLKALKNDIYAMQPILASLPDKRCKFFESNKNVIELFLNVIERLTTSLQFLDETNFEEKEKKRIKIVTLDDNILNVLDKFVRNLPCSVNILNYNQLALKYVSLKSLMQVRLEKDEKIGDIDEAVEKFKKEIAEAAGGSATYGLSSTFIPHGRSLFTLGSQSTSVSAPLPSTSTGAPTLVLQPNNAGSFNPGADNSNTLKEDMQQYPRDMENDD